MISLYNLVDIPGSSLPCEIIPYLVLRKKTPPICMIYPYSGVFETVSELIRFVHLMYLMLISHNIQKKLEMFR